MQNLSNNLIPEEVKRLRLCKALENCGTNVESSFKESHNLLMSIFDDTELGYVDWSSELLETSDVFIARNTKGKCLVLLPLDNRIISGPNITKGGVADCAVLTKEDFSLIEFKTNVFSNSQTNIDSKTEDAIKQLWHTYSDIIEPNCKDKGIEISNLVNVDFYIIFDKSLDVTSAMASRLNYQTDFLEKHKYPLFFENEKEF